MSYEENFDSQSDTSFEGGNIMLEKIILEHEIVFNSRAYNYEHCRIPILSHLNIDFFKFFLCDYADKDILHFLEYGFPLGADDPSSVLTSDLVELNHKGAIDYPDHIDKFLQKEILKGSIIGPFDSTEIPSVTTF